MTRSFGKLGAVAIAVVGCTSHWHQVPASHPFEEIVVATDGTEAILRLAQGVSMSSVVELRQFGSFRPGITPAEAQTAFGPPARVERRGDATVYVYEGGAGIVWIVEWEERSSADGSRIPRLALESPVQDPPFAAGLPAPIRQLLSSEGRLESIAISPSQTDDPVVRLSVANGRVRAVGIARRAAPSADSLLEGKGRPTKS
jgi:hypothetical protein